jgi:hypothetical protein
MQKNNPQWTQELQKNLSSLYYMLANTIDKEKNKEYTISDSASEIK